MNSVYAAILYCVLCAYYCFFALQLTTINDIIAFTGVYIGCLTLLKIWLDKGIYLSLYHIVAVAYFYYIAKEVWFLNPMLSEFRDFEVVPAVLIISVANVLMLTGLACNSNKDLLDSAKPRDKSQGLYLSKWVTLPIFLIYVALMAVPAYLTLTLGRTQVYDKAFASISLAVPFLNAMGYLLPAFIHFSFNKGRMQLLLKVAMISLVFMIQVGIGNRFVILFSFFIFISMMLDVRKVELKKIALPLVFLSVLSVTMTQLRTGGEAAENVSTEAAADSEGIVYYMSGLVKYYKENSHSYTPVYSTFSLYFLVPRAIWPGKPELIGSWVLDTGVFHHNFSEGHSGSVSFVGPFFADFGYLFFIPMIVIGASLVKLDRYLLQYVGEYSARGIIAASFVPLVFFSYRSFNTSVAAEVILVCMVIGVTRFNKLTSVSR